jgi:hypothetical protein
LTGPTYDAVVTKTAKPDEAVRKLQYFNTVFSYYVQPDEFPYLRGAILSRHAQRQATTVLEDFYQKIMTAPANQIGLVQDFVRRVSEIELPGSGVIPVVRPIGSFTMGTDNGGNLIGNRFTCRGGSLLIWGPTGAGKSSLIIQFAHCMALGRDWFGIPPVGPLRVLYVSAENDAGDITEIRDGIRGGMGLTGEECKAVDERLHVACIDNKSGLAFVATLKTILRASEYDLVIVDPLPSYFGDDLNDASAAAAWLEPMRELMHQHGCALVLVHHTPKPLRGTSKSGRAGNTEASYSFLGSQAFISWCRAGISLSRLTDDGLFELRFVKRGSRKRLPWIMDSKVNIAWDRDGEDIYWRTAKGQEPRAGVDPLAPVPTDLLKYMPDDKPVSRTWLISTAVERLAVGRNKAIGWIELLEADGLVERAALPSNGGRKPVGWAKTKEGAV